MRLPIPSFVNSIPYDKLVSSRDKSKFIPNSNIPKTKNKRSASLDRMDFIFSPFTKVTRDPIHQHCSQHPTETRTQKRGRQRPNPSRNHPKSSNTVKTEREYYTEFSASSVRSKTSTKSSKKKETKSLMWKSTGSLLLICTLVTCVGVQEAHAQDSRRVSPQKVSLDAFPPDGLLFLPPTTQKPTNKLSLDYRINSHQQIKPERTIFSQVEDRRILVEDPTFSIIRPPTVISESPHLPRNRQAMPISGLLKQDTIRNLASQNENGRIDRSDVYDTYYYDDDEESTTSKAYDLYNYYQYLDEFEDYLEEENESNVEPTTNTPPTESITTEGIENTKTTETVVQTTTNLPLSTNAPITTVTEEIELETESYFPSSTVTPHPLTTTSTPTTTTTVSTAEITQIESEVRSTTEKSKTNKEIPKYGRGSFRHRINLLKEKRKEAAKSRNHNTETTAEKISREAKRNANEEVDKRQLDFEKRLKNRIFTSPAPRTIPTPVSKRGEKESVKGKSIIQEKKVEILEVTTEFPKFSAQYSSVTKKMGVVSDNNTERVNITSDVGKIDTSNLDSINNITNQTAEAEAESDSDLDDLKNQTNSAATENIDVMSNEETNYTSTAEGVEKLVNAKLSTYNDSIARSSSGKSLYSSSKEDAVGDAPSDLILATNSTFESDVRNTTESNDTKKNNPETNTNIPKYDELDSNEFQNKSPSDALDLTKSNFDNKFELSDPIKKSDTFITIDETVSEPTITELLDELLNHSSLLEVNASVAEILSQQITKFNNETYKLTGDHDMSLLTELDLNETKSIPVETTITLFTDALKSINNNKQSSEQDEEIEEIEPTDKIVKENKLLFNLKGKNKFSDYEADVIEESNPKSFDSYKEKFEKSFLITEPFTYTSHGGNNVDSIATTEVDYATDSSISDSTLNIITRLPPKSTSHSSLSRLNMLLNQFDSGSRPELSASSKFLGIENKNESRRGNQKAITPLKLLGTREGQKSFGKPIFDINNYYKDFQSTEPQELAGNDRHFISDSRITLFSPDLNDLTLAASEGTLRASSELGEAKITGKQIDKLNDAIETIKDINSSSEKPTTSKPAETIEPTIIKATAMKEDSNNTKPEKAEYTATVIEQFVTDLPQALKSTSSKHNTSTKSFVSTSVVNSVTTVLATTANTLFTTTIMPDKTTTYDTKTTVDNNKTEHSTSTTMPEVTTIPNVITTAMPDNSTEPRSTTPMPDNSTEPSSTTPMPDITTIPDVLATTTLSENEVELIKSSNITISDVDKLLDKDSNSTVIEEIIEKFPEIVDITSSRLTAKVSDTDEATNTTLALKKFLLMRQNDDRNDTIGEKAMSENGVVLSNDAVRERLRLLRIFKSKKERQTGNTQIKKHFNKVKGATKVYQRTDKVDLEDIGVRVNTAVKLRDILLKRHEIERLQREKEQELIKELERKAKLKSQTVAPATLREQLMKLKAKNEAKKRKEKESPGNIVKVNGFRVIKDDDDYEEYQSTTVAYSVEETTTEVTPSLDSFLPTVVPNTAALSREINPSSVTLPISKELYTIHNVIFNRNTPSHNVRKNHIQKTTPNSNKMAALGNLQDLLKRQVPRNESSSLATRLKNKMKQGFLPTLKPTKSSEKEAEQIEEPVTESTDDITFVFRPTTAPDYSKELNSEREKDYETEDYTYYDYPTDESYYYYDTTELPIVSDKGKFKDHLDYATPRDRDNSNKLLDKLKRDKYDSPLEHLHSSSKFRNEDKKSAKGGVEETVIVGESLKKEINSFLSELTLDEEEIDELEQLYYEEFGLTKSYDERHDDRRDDHLFETAHTTSPIDNRFNRYSHKDTDIDEYVTESNIFEVAPNLGEASNGEHLNEEVVPKIRFVHDDVIRIPPRPTPPSAILREIFTSKPRSGPSKIAVVKTKIPSKLGGSSSISNSNYNSHDYSHQIRKPHEGQNEFNTKKNVNDFNHQIRNPSERQSEFNTKKNVNDYNFNNSRDHSSEYSFNQNKFRSTDHQITTSIPDNFQNFKRVHLPSYFTDKNTFTHEENIRRAPVNMQILVPNTESPYQSFVGNIAHDGPLTSVGNSFDSHQPVITTLAPVHHSFDFQTTSVPQFLGRKTIGTNTNMHFKDNVRVIPYNQQSQIIHHSSKNDNFSNFKDFGSSFRKSSSKGNFEDRSESRKSVTNSAEKKTISSVFNFPQDRGSNIVKPTPTVSDFQAINANSRSNGVFADSLSIFSRTPKPSSLNLPKHSQQIEPKKNSSPNIPRKSFSHFSKPFTPKSRKVGDLNSSSRSGSKNRDIYERNPMQTEIPRMIGRKVVQQSLSPFNSQRISQTSRRIITPRSGIILHLAKNGGEIRSVSQLEEEGIIPGKPGVDYPRHRTVPRHTRFNCDEHMGGSEPGIGHLFPDISLGCQIYHLCQAGKKTSFICPIGTVFNQVTQTCQWWHTVSCLGT